MTMISRICLALLMVTAIPLWSQAENIEFDTGSWETGRMDAQFPDDSGGPSTLINVDYYYYYARMPMRMASLQDSLAAGSAQRTYDSAMLALVVGSSGLLGSDQMRIFGKRLTRNWSENGVSWSHYWASPDSNWTTAGGDVNSLPGLDTVIVDASTASGDTLYFYLDTGLVRSMVEGDNFGWLMMAENIVDRGVFGFYTEDETNTARKPRLIIYFTDGGAGQIPLALRRRRMIH